ncbi:MAG: hypothetical protein QF578_20550 [Alphaproteobacteria bacterium]|nr:hypothetical protein [Alphaproteobacteria bacterium]
MSPQHMSTQQEITVWSMVVLGVVIYILTFVMAWESTSDYRANVMGAQSAIEQPLLTGPATSRAA